MNLVSWMFHMLNILSNSYNCLLPTCKCCRPLTLRGFIRITTKLCPWRSSYNSASGSSSFSTWAFIPLSSSYKLLLSFPLLWPTPFSLPPYRDPHPSSFPSTMTPRVCLFFVCFFYLFILLSFSSPPSVCFFYYVLLRLVLHFAVRERE